jgi:hypothetical protein
MSLKLLYTRLALGLAVASVTFACTAALDFDELQREWAGGNDSSTLDSSTKDDANKDKSVTDNKVPPDKGGCVSGSGCRITGKQGRCSYGEAICNEAGTGTCKSKGFVPITETCNGTTPFGDWDCDGKLDANDADAHKSCGTGKYCAGQSCVSGCWADTQCKKTNTDKCHTNHQCRCGTSSPCNQPNPVCNNGQCRCDADSRCSDQETCQNGVCYCGSKVGTAAGPFCAAGICNPITGICVGAPPPDAGPDNGPPDQGLTPDKAAPSPDQAAPAPDQTLPTPDQ